MTKEELTKEIKEILDNISNKWEDYYVQDIVSGNELKQLLDYITNLQKENEQLKKCNRESITFLNQDDIRDILIRKDNKIFELQQRIDKAIDWVNNHDVDDGWELLEILEVNENK